MEDEGDYATYYVIDELQANSSFNGDVTTFTTEGPHEYLELVESNVTYQNSTNTHNRIQNTDYNDIKAALKANKNCMNVMAFMLAILLLMTITATAMAVFSYVAKTSIQPIDNTLANRSPELMNIMNDFSSQFDQLAQVTWTNVSQVLTQLSEQVSHQNNLNINCGPGLWHRVAYFNMSDPSQQCPPAWREYNTSEVRACGRPNTTDQGSCPGTLYSISHQYSIVCGRVIGYQYGSPDAFGNIGNKSIVVDGINITYGTSNNHIWTYAAGVTEVNNYVFPHTKCPCNVSRAPAARPAFIGDNYYCESGNQNNNWEPLLYSHDKLWDGQQCEGTCCTRTKFPPWFTVWLDAKTNDAIKVTICCDEGTNNEDITIELLEIYVQ